MHLQPDGGRAVRSAPEAGDEEGERAELFPRSLRAQQVGTEVSHLRGAQTRCSEDASHQNTARSWIKYSNCTF